MVEILRECYDKQGVYHVLLPDEKQPIGWYLAKSARYGTPHKTCMMCKSTTFYEKNTFCHVCRFWTGILCCEHVYMDTRDFGGYCIADEHPMRYWFDKEDGESFKSQFAFCGIVPPPFREFCVKGTRRYVTEKD